MNEHIKALQSGDGKGYLPRDVAEKLRAEGLVEIHPSMADHNGNPAVRLTEKGTAMNTTAMNTAPANTATIVFDEGIPKPEKAARGAARKPGLYDNMPVGASVHFAGDPKELIKKHSSLPNSLTRRFSEPVVGPDGQPVMETRKSKKKGEYQAQKRNATRKFSLARVDANDPRGPGVRLFRDA